MDQLKEFLRQCIKYRFWISLSVAALFAIVAYFLGSRPVNEATTKETNAITSAHKDVQQYAAPGIPNGQYKPIVDEKTAILTKDVNTAWKELYTRQAPLLTWPKQVGNRFSEWGRKWPEQVAESAVQLAIVDYISGAYQDYVDQVYKTFHPFDPETGEGIVSAPPKEALLKPSNFEITAPPKLGKVWAAQERLWIQRTVLEVIAQVNKNAKDWDSAIIKQLNLLEVGNSVAQDQRSIAKGETLQEAKAILAPGEEEASTDAGADAASNPMGGMASSMMMMQSRMGGMMGGATGAVENIYYVQPENDKGQFNTLPILISVLIDQERIQDLLVELENSPMSIQVKDFELQRPSSKVTKPEKGMGASFAGYAQGMMGSMMGSMMPGRLGRGGFGGMAGGYASMMSRGYADMMAGQMSSMAMGMRGRGGMGGMMGGMGGGDDRKGTDKRSTDRGKQRKEELKKLEETKGPSQFDPHYNIVEVKIYGQARFYNSPPAEAPEEPASPGEATSEETPKTEEPAKTEAPAKTEPAKTEAPAKTEPAKAEAPAKTEAPAKAEEPAKTAAPAESTPKTEAPKS